MPAVNDLKPNLNPDREPPRSITLPNPAFTTGLPAVEFADAHTVPHAAVLQRRNYPPPVIEPGTATEALRLLLADKRSASTRRAYEGDLRDFFRGQPTEEMLGDFLALSPPAVALRLARYKAELLERGAAEATVNRRLAAVRSLLRFTFRLGLSETDGRGLVDSERSRSYRDTRGVDHHTLARLLALPKEIYGAENLRALRDTALLRLLCENALRRAEVCGLDAGDFNLEDRTVMIRGKGRGSEKEPVTLSGGTASAIAAYLQAAGHGGEPSSPLFRNLDHRPGKTGARLSVDGLFFLVGHYGRILGVAKLTPHKLRHSAITAALDMTGGDVRRVQRLSRHAKLETLQRYDDNRTDMQGEVTRGLETLLSA